MKLDIFHHNRRLGIGGSDVAIILGLSSYKTPYQLYLEKIGLLDTENLLTPSQEWGIRHEATIREKFKEKHNITIELPTQLIHPKYDFIRGHLDGYIPEWNCVLEIKTSHQCMANQWGQEETDQIPLPYLCQVAHYCMLKQADYGYIAVLIGGNDYREFKYERDKEIETMILEAEIKFWECVQNNNPPEPTNIEDLKLLYSIPEDKKIAYTHTESPILSKLSQTKEQLKELKKQEEACKFELMKYMGNHEYLTDMDDNIVASWKPNKNGKRVFLMK